MGPSCPAFPYIRFQTVETGKNAKKTVDDLRKKKRSSEIFGVKMELFSFKSHSKIWSAKKFSRPPKLGAKSPPMVVAHLKLRLWKVCICIISHIMGIFRGSFRVKLPQ